MRSAHGDKLRRMSGGERGWLGKMRSGIGIEKWRETFDGRDD